MDSATIRRRYDSLVSQRKTLDNTFQVIEKYVVPFRGEFFKPMDSEHEVEWRRRLIFDSTAIQSADLLTSKISSSITSPHIRWFELKFRNNELKKSNEALVWLEEVQNRIWYSLVYESDFNSEAPEIYLDLVCFGTSIMFEEELDEEEWKGIAFTAIPVRDSYFEYGSDDNVLRFYRRLQFTRLQLEDKFPDYDFADFEEDENADVDIKHEVIFCVYQRDKKEATTKMKPENRPWGYKYILHNSAECLDEGGYYEMPSYVTRWKKTSGSAWGHSQAMICLSDILQLNEVTAQTSEARAKEIDPPMKTTERGLISDLDLMPGGLTVVTDMDELDRLLDPNPTLFQADQEKADLKQSIERSFYIDKIQLKESPVMTATEVVARTQQIIEQFAPTMGRLQADLLDPLMENTYRILERNGRLPELPPELSEIMSVAEIEVDYISPIPMAMKGQMLNAIITFFGHVANFAQIKPEVLDIINDDAFVREMADAAGVPARLLNDEADVEAIRELRAQKQEAMDKIAAAQGVADVQKTVSESNEAQ